jgi:glycine/D-amino acid oxidase-like deaminating enzyme
LEKQEKIDYIVVGAGLAGIAFIETCLKNNKTVCVFDDASQNSSKIAAGIYNPVVLKRFSGIEYSDIQLAKASAFYNSLEQKLKTKFDHKIEVLRKFLSVEEQNNWFLAADKPNVSDFLSLEIEHHNIEGIDAPFGFGKVFRTGYIDTALLLDRYHAFLQSNGFLSIESFEYSKIKMFDNSIIYKSISAKNIVFAEGYGLRNNMYFNFLPLDGTKGELLIIKAEKLELKNILNSSLYIVPLRNSYFKVGATYEWKDKTEYITIEGRYQLIDKLKSIINCDFEIINHLAGIRPTVRDRKIMLGSHHVYKNMHIMNGMGTRGVMQAPWAAELLFDSIENKILLDKTINISRYRKFCAEY